MILIKNKAIRYEKIVKLARDFTQSKKESFKATFYVANGNEYRQCLRDRLQDNQMIDVLIQNAFENSLFKLEAFPRNYCENRAKTATLK